MEWPRDLSDWPLSQHSRQVRAKPHIWHVQELGAGPTVLLLHGAGGSTHSWANLIPLLARDHHVVAIDLPGQGFTLAGTKSRLGLRTMAQDLCTLLNDQDWSPNVIIGHSAGAALALQTSSLLGEQIRVVGINAALESFDGIAGWLFPILAKALALNPLTAVALTMGGSAMSRARGLIRTTGSHIPEDNLRCYARLFSDRSHVDSTLRMMAQWDIDMLSARIFTLETRALLIAGSGDLTVPAAVSKRAAVAMKKAEYAELDGLGHLAHEEDPDRVFQAISNWLNEKNRTQW